MNRDDWNNRYAKTELVWSASANQFLVAEVENLPPGRALDLAAGEGRNALWLAERGWTVDAVDFSDVAIGKGKALAEARDLAEKVTFQAADLREHAIEPGTYDLVAVMYFHMPWEALAPVLTRAARGLVPGGTFLLVSHDLENPTRGHGGPKDPAVLPTAAQVASALEGELTIERAEQVERIVQTDDGPKVALDCLVRGKRV
jgi:SAM-dependent methyltransferase